MLNFFLLFNKQKDLYSNNEYIFITIIGGIKKCQEKIKQDQKVKDQELEEV